jgi:hypothetical protein
MNTHFNNEGHEHKTGHAKGGYKQEGRLNEKVKEDEYGRCTFYICMNI